MAVATTRMTGSRFFAEMMRANGVTHSFFVPTFMLPALSEMDRLGVKMVSAHGEKAAAYMADGYARASGRPGVCMAQTVGAANLSAGLKDAYMASSPVIALTGGPYTETRFRHVYQEIRDYPFFETVTKWHASVEHVTRLPELLRQAFRVATTGCPGPVHLEVRGHWGQIVDPEADLDLVFEPRFAQVPAFRPEADPDSIAAAAQELAGASRPVIVAGGGVISSGAEAEVAQLAERLSAPVATSMNGKPTLAETHPLNVGLVGHYSRRCANEVVSEADLVFYIGSHTGSMVTNNWLVPKPGTPVIHLDIDPQELGRHYPTKVALNGDARATLRRLIAAVQPRTNDAWVGRAQELVRRWREEVAPRLNSDQSPVRPERICAEIAEVLPADGAVVVDTLQAAIWAGSLIALKGPGQRFIRCAGSLGWGLPATLGAKCALGERAVVGFTGDGGVYYHLAELETAARHGINAVIVVNNNGAYAGERVLWDEPYGGQQSKEGLKTWNFGDIGFAKVAEELGCLGIRVERAGDIADAIRRGLASGRPTLIDVLSDPTAIHPKGWAPGA